MVEFTRYYSVCHIFQGMSEYYGVSHTDMLIYTIITFSIVSKHHFPTFGQLGLYENSQDL